MHNLPFLCTLLVIAGIMGSSLSVMLPADIYQNLMKHSKRSSESFLGDALAEAEGSHTVEGSAVMNTHIAQAETRGQAEVDHPGLGPLPRLEPVEQGVLALRDTNGQQGNPTQASEPVRFALGDDHHSPNSQQYSGYNPESDNESDSVGSERFRDASHSDPKMFNPQHNSDYQSEITSIERARWRHVFLGNNQNFGSQHHPDYDSDALEVRSWSHGVTTSEAEEIEAMPTFDRDSDYSQSPSASQNSFDPQHHSESERRELLYGLSPRSAEEGEGTPSVGQGSDHSQRTLASSGVTVGVPSRNSERHSEDINDTATSYPNKRHRFYARQL